MKEIIMIRITRSIQGVLEFGALSAITHSIYQVVEY